MGRLVVKATGREKPPLADKNRFKQSALLPTKIYFVQKAGRNNELLLNASSALHLAFLDLIVEVSFDFH